MDTQAPSTPQAFGLVVSSDGQWVTGSKEAVADYQRSFGRERVTEEEFAKRLGL